MKTKRLPGIYLVASQLDGVHYVGGTYNYYRRWQEHFRRIENKIVRAYSREFLPALRKGKLSIFLLEKLPKNCTQKYLEKREQYWMDQFPDRVNKYRYSTPKGNKNLLGYHHTKATRKKLSLAGMGRTHSAATRKKLSKSHEGREYFPASPETRAKMSKSRMGNQNAKGHIHSPETREKLRKANTGRILSADARAKISKASKGHIVSDETRKKIGLASKGRIPSVETRTKMSKAKMGNQNARKNTP